MVANIFKTSKFIPACARYAKNKVLQEELHSEFIKVLLEQPEDTLKAYEGGYFDVHCISIINNIWGKKDRHKRTVGQTSPLFVYSSTFEVPVSKNEDGLAEEEYFSIPQPDYDCSVDYSYLKAKDVIEKEFFHENKERMYKARVFYYSQPIPFIKKDEKEFYPTFGSPTEYSRRSGIQFTNVYMTYKRFKDFIKEKLK